MDDVIKKYNNEIYQKMLDFITKAAELVDLSKDDYQIEKSLKLNKISLKAYLLDSPCCVELKEKNVKNYSIDELKKYLTDYEKRNNEDCFRYHLAIILYEEIEDIEKTVDNKIDLEISELDKVIPDIKNIKEIDKSEYEKLYLELKGQLDNNIFINMLNDVFNFYISSYPTVPDDHIYKFDN